MAYSWKAVGCSLAKKGQKWNLNYDLSDKKLCFSTDNSMKTLVPEGTFPESVAW